MANTLTLSHVQAHIDALAAHVDTVAQGHRDAAVRATVTTPAPQPAGPDRK